uniref:ATP synthase subunit a n=1 Tax=Allobates magnussoni TaxID=2772346 RepID=A0A7M3USU3_9NEOB|nr:ATP synthase F0 subunit 6 [Allobates magnussoni]
MTMDLFTQFASPTVLGISMFAVITSLPWSFFFTPHTFWCTNRATSLTAYLVKFITKQIFTPIDVFGHKWALIFTALMTFLFGLNLMGLIPYTFTPTTQLSLNLGLATPFWLATVVLGVRYRLTHTLGHLLPKGTPTPLSPMLILLETVSLIIRPIALGVRLTANLTAGHLLLQLISMATYSQFFDTILLSGLSFVALILLYILEIAVAVIQAYVFVLLLSLYLQENVDSTNK